MTDEQQNIAIAELCGCMENGFNYANNNKMWPMWKKYWASDH